MERYYTISEAAHVFGVCTKTIRRWDAAGMITCKRTVGNHRRISIFEIERILQGKIQEKTKTVAIYGRVSSHDQKKKGDLDRQVQAMKEYCKEKGHAELDKKKWTGDVLADNDLKPVTSRKDAWYVIDRDHNAAKNIALKRHDYLKRNMRSKDSESKTPAPREKVKLSKNIKIITRKGRKNPKTRKNKPKR